MVDYDYKKLIDVYIKAQQPYPHEDFSKFYSGLLEKLESLFGIKILREGVSLLEIPNPALGMHFNAVVTSYLSITHPRSGYAEDTLVNKRLDELGRRGKKIFDLERQIMKLNDQSEALHLQLLYELFLGIYGEMNKVVTSEQVLAAGFDDAKEPKFTDYWPEM